MPSHRLAAIVALSGIAGLGALVTPATATTSASTSTTTPGAAPAAAAAKDVRPFALAAVDLVGRDGARYSVGISAYGDDSVDATRARFAIVTVDRCPSSCTRVLDARFAVSKTGLTIADDLGVATLRTALGGLPIAVSWTATAPAALPGFQRWLTPAVRSGQWRTATARATVFGATCTARFPSIGREVYVSAVDPYTPRTATVPAALRPARTGKRVACAPPA
jgi:hypothetical protein